jgi:hypothetical protein
MRFGKFESLGRNSVAGPIVSRKTRRVFRIMRTSKDLFLFFGSFLLGATVCDTVEE